MPVDQDSLEAIRPEFRPDERVLWAGRPSPRFKLRKEDAFLIPFSLLWGGFAIFWELGVTGYGTKVPSGMPWFLVLWGIPFVVAGQYLIWGRFVFAAWKKKRTFYAVTSKRVIVVQDSWSRRSSSAYIDTLPLLTREGRAGKSGTIRFGPSEFMWARNRGWGAWDSMAMGAVPMFVDIDDADQVYQLVSDLRDKIPGSHL